MPPLSRAPFRFSRRGLDAVAQKWCNPYHRVELRGVIPACRPAFHKVINIFVENLTRNKFSLLRFGISRAITPRVPLLTTYAPRCYIFFSTFSMSESIRESYEGPFSLLRMLWGNLASRPLRCALVPAGRGRRDGNPGVARGRQATWGTPGATDPAGAPYFCVVSCLLTWRRALRGRMA